MEDSREHLIDGLRNFLETKPVVFGFDSLYRCIEAALADIRDRKASIKNLIDKNCELEARVIFLESAMRDAQGLLANTDDEHADRAFVILDDARNDETL